MATPETTAAERPAEERDLAGINADYKEKFGFHDPESGYAYKSPKGLSREVVESISEYKDEPQWMRDFRIKAYEHFESRPTPQWGGNLNQIDFDNIHYFVRASDKNSRDWSEVPEDIKNTFDRLGIPEAERKFLSGVGAQYESEVVYHQVNEKLEEQGAVGCRLCITDGVRCRVVPVKYLQVVAVCHQRIGQSKIRIFLDCLPKVVDSFCKPVL